MVLSKVISKIQIQMPEINFASVDTEEYPELMEICGVERVPTVVVFKNGEIRNKKSGVMNPSEMINFYQQA